MRWTRWTVMVSWLGALVIAAVTLSCASMQVKAPAVMTQEQKLERSEYLTIIGGCNDCHTPAAFFGNPDFDRRLAGAEMGWVGPWGTSYARNLTPDIETGIGTWSEDDIVKTIRTGQLANGSPGRRPAERGAAVGRAPAAAHSPAARWAQKRKRPANDRAIPFQGGLWVRPSRREATERGSWCLRSALPSLHAAGVSRTRSFT